MRQRAKGKGESRSWARTRSSPFFAFNTRCLARRLLDLPELADRTFLLPSGHTLYCCDDDHAPHHHLQENEHAWHDGVVLCLCGACVPAPKHPDVATFSLSQLRPTLLWVRKWKRRLLRRLCGTGTVYARQVDQARYASVLSSFQTAIRARKTLAGKERIEKMHQVLVNVGARFGETPAPLPDLAAQGVAARGTARVGTTAARAAVRCGCAGPCSTLACSCKKANQACTVRCHKKKCHDTCSNFSLAP